ncbi:NAD-dependent epimerase/dehydratase family protein [Marinifilum sp. N1E240]|uniref:NAD-dependent epimerase/dehydratase family protein n=1 Tax=Marinifilum sp. N1E240 TaxID=2608082 RepID=UPI00128E53F7|nr:NAD-dependent epimerase/dehydratase family protein [Marinifilum sp. N1E240]MPQ46465.1 NAD-dependent epimerase/dehydratase family protein [Marinifilum sp. N1E240]
MNKKKLLITGISGFVGQNLVKYFNNQSVFKLYGLDIVFKEIVGVEKIYSWNSLEEIRDIDIVIHLAGKAHDLKKTSDEQAYFDINYGLTKQIYDWFLTTNCSKFFLMSSVKAVADVVQGAFLTEEVKPAPITAYGRSKIKAEEYLLSKKLPTEKSFFILRPCMIHGPGNKGNLNLLYRFAKSGIPYPLGAFENKRSFLSVENLCFVFKEFINRDIDSGIYQLSDDESLSTNELISIISNTLGKKSKIWNLPETFIVRLAKFGTRLKLPLTEERLVKLTENYVVSNDKIKKVLERNLPVSAREGLIKTIESFSSLSK